MTIDTILAQLSGLKGQANPRQVSACEAAISILAALQDREGIGDPEQVMDMLCDYRAQARLCRELHLRYEAPTGPVCRDHGYHCPQCGRRIQTYYNHCPECGKRLIRR